MSLTAAHGASAKAVSKSALSDTASPARQHTRLIMIDALRGLVIVFMLLDHVRETVFLHHQVSDPMDVSSTDPLLFWSRTLAHLCAPVFVLLTGMSAYLYQQQKQDLTQTRRFLFKRGLFLIVLECTLVNFAWTAQFPPQVIYLQVIWAIGISMVALALLIGLPKVVQALLAFIIIFGHNLLDGLSFSNAAQTPNVLDVIWHILHQRGWIEVSDGFRLRTSYPVLPWIGVILAGYLLGSVFEKSSKERNRSLLLYGFGSIALFILLRFINIYGDAPWVYGNASMQTLMSFFNLTKYPPSLFFILWNVGLGLLLLVVFDRLSISKNTKPTNLNSANLKAHVAVTPPTKSTPKPTPKWISALVVFGSVPMFFYLLHLYVLKVIYLIGEAIFGLNQGEFFGVNHMLTVWLIMLVLTLALYPIVRWFSKFKHSHKHIRILKYF